MNRPILVPILFFLAGIFVSGLFDISIAGKYVPIFIISGIILIGLLISKIRKKIFFYCLLYFLFLFLGVFKYGTFMGVPENDISRFVPDLSGRVLVHGTVMGNPEWKGATYNRYLAFPLRIERILTDNNEKSAVGTVYVKLYTETKRPYIGDRLAIEGKMSFPRERQDTGFDYKTYLKRMDIRVVMASIENNFYLKTGRVNGPIIFIRRILSRCRENADFTLHRYLMSNTRSVVRSIVLGLRGDMPRSVKDVFMKTGTMHILAVSGLHIGIVAVIFMGLLKYFRCPRNLRCVLVILIMCMFAIFAGGRPSSVRAAIMGAFILFSVSLERKPDIVGALVLSAFLITLFSPGQFFNAGFILSYVAVLSIIYITPFTDKVFGSWLNGKYKHGTKNIFTKTREYFLKIISVSLAIWIGMMPVIIYYFKIITPSTIFANIIAIPVLFLMVTLGFCMLAIGSLNFLYPAAWFLAGILNAIITFFINSMTAISHIPFSHIEVSGISTTFIVIFYVVLISVILWRKKPAKQS